MVAPVLQDPAPNRAESFRFETRFCLKPLVAVWRDLLSSCTEHRRQYIRDLLERFDRSSLVSYKTDQLLPVEEQKLVGELLQLSLPEIPHQSLLLAASHPFDIKQPVYQNQGFHQLIGGGDVEYSSHDPIDSTSLAVIRQWWAYRSICKLYFQKEFPFRPQQTFLSVKNRTTGLYRHFDFGVDLRYMHISSDIDRKAISEATWTKLFTHFDLAFWERHLPPECFRFEGLALIRATDITSIFEFNRIQKLLLSARSLQDACRFIEIEGCLRNIFQSRDMSLGLSLRLENFYLSIHSNVESRILADKGELRPCHELPISRFSLKTWEASVYEQAIAGRRSVYFNDFHREADPQHPVHTRLLERGTQSLMLFPLFFNESNVGIFELYASHTGAFSSLTEDLIKNLLPLFSLVMQRYIDEFQNNIDLILKEKCTSLHPAIEWRFREMAQEFIFRQMRHHSPSDFPKIVLEDIYPLFGQSDIRHSSDLRNAAIAEDLRTQAQLAQDLIGQLKGIESLDVLDQIAYQVDIALQQLAKGINARDEQQITAFFRDDFRRALDDLETFDGRYHHSINAYRAVLDSQHHMVYRARKDFDESVKTLNQLIAEELEKGQASIQKIMPHYFEKHVTDGVEHTIYVGRDTTSLGRFSLLHLRNLRLWQLQTMCRIAREAVKISAKLPTRLQLAHLVMVQNTTLTLSFDYNEKDFQVEGAYNIRHQIVKKRIDKASIRGSAERLTKVNWLAIVYTQDSEEKEYLGYLDYLAHQKEVEGPIEQHELEDLQGLQGLKALRVRISGI